MATHIQFLRGTTAEADAYTGLVGELYLDLDSNSIRIHDGVKVGGYVVANASSVNDQPLNTTDNVTFNNATVTEFTTPTISGVTNIVSGASPDQYMYISTVSGETTFTNAAFKYSSVYSGPINELVGATVVDELKIGSTIELSYAPTILASINPGTSSRIDVDIIAGIDNTSGPVRGQINIGENNTEVVNIGTTGIAKFINIGDTFSATTTTIGGNVNIDTLTVGGDTVLGFPTGTTTINGSIEVINNVITNTIQNTGNISITAGSSLNLTATTTNFTGTVDLSNATVTGLSAPYTPAVDLHWTDPNPTTVGAALDRIAAVLQGLLGGPIA